MLKWNININKTHIYHVKFCTHFFGKFSISISKVLYIMQKDFKRAPTYWRSPNKKAGQGEPTAKVSKPKESPHMGQKKKKKSRGPQIGNT